MGCRVSSHDSTTSSIENTMPRYTDEVDHKARLERKMCLARETPEPIFDLSDCNLKEVPSGVFVLCRVLRKESLILSKNKLHSLNSGGVLNDLVLLTILDLRCNKFKKLPDDIYKLENLRELLISENQLSTLPPTIKLLRNLELIDVANNDLMKIDQISCMPHLRILNVSGNKLLTILPPEIATCNSLTDLILDVELIQNPPMEVTSKGTFYILQYLSTGEISIDPNHQLALDNINQTKRFLSAEIKQDPYPIVNYDEQARAKTESLLEMERQALEKDHKIEAQLHNQQQKKRQELLQELLMQQTETDSRVNQLQQEKELDRNRLITDILKEEANWNMIVEQLLSLKTGPDPILLDQEMIEQEKLLEQVRIQQTDLRKQEILTAMTDFLENEINRVQLYQEQRDASSRVVLERETENNILLHNVFTNYDKNRSEMIDQINHDEMLQKTAVATLIAKNDARSWGLVEQLRIVESQLAAMTYYEIEKKKISNEEQVNELAERRIYLTYILMDLLEQQEQRKSQLLDTLQSMESLREDRQDFWLLQYQRLIDSQPGETDYFHSSVDPLLGYNFLVNGVVHCLPFLSRLWQNKEKTIDSITEDDLIAAGIKNERDRSGIMKSINDFIKDEGGLTTCVPTPSAPITEPASNTKNDFTRSESNRAGEELTECVICMDDRVKIIFLPCGHLCCCQQCQVNLQECPMCRAIIEQRIRVIQA